MRKKGDKQHKENYNLKMYDIVNKDWVDCGNFPTYRDISERIELSYEVVYKICKKKSKKYGKMYRIEKI